MAVVSTFDGANRRIYLSAVTVNSEWHPVDIYREYRAERRTNESFRVWDSFMSMEGNIPKGGGKATPRFLLLLGGVKIVPYDAVGTTTSTGEIITDDQSDVFDYTSLTNPLVVNIAAPEAEILYVSGGNVDLTALTALVEAIKGKTDDLTFSKANELDVNQKSINDSRVYGSGTDVDKWRGTP